MTINGKIFDEEKQIIGVFGTKSERKSTLNEALLRANNIFYKNYDFIRLFIAYMCKNGKSSFDVPLLVSYLIIGCDTISLDDGTKQRIKKEYAELQEALQNAMNFGLITTASNREDTERSILITKEESIAIINSYEENYCLQAENFVQRYLGALHMQEMIAEDFREDEKREEIPTTPTRVLKRDDAERLKDIQQMIKQDFENDE